MPKLNTANTMNTRTFLVAVIMTIATTTQAQYFFHPEIVPLDGIEFCQGYTSEHVAHFRMISQFPNFASLPYVYVTYTWVAEHPKGRKEWNTGNRVRAVPLPWEGEYTVQVRVEFIRLGFANPFSTIWSNRIKIVARDCDDSLRYQPGASGTGQKNLSTQGMKN